MNWRDIEDRRARLAEQAAKRFSQRSSERERTCDQINRDGVLKTAGTDSAVRRVAHMTVQEGRMLSARRSLESGAVASINFEAVLGADDSDHINFMLRGHVAARAVCRLAIGSQPVGTGFLVAPGLLLTNNHVIASAEDAKRFVAEFDYELDLNDQPRVPVVRFSLDPDKIFVTSSQDDLDFTFVAVKEKSLEQRRSLREFGWIPMDERVDKILTGEPAVIIQHPRGEQKRVCIFSAELVDKLPQHLHYTTDTDGGSSGSSVFNRSWQLVALHHAAVPTGKKRKGQEVMVNEGIRVSSILGALRTGKLVEEDEDRVDDRELVLRTVTGADVVRDGRPQLGGELRIPGIGVLAAEPSTRKGGRKAVPEARRTVIRTRSTRIFDGRAAAHFGYKARFLGQEVPLPELPSELADDVATTEDGEQVLAYTHYSVILSASRRLPIVTAVNINGAQSVRLGRKDRDWEAAADTWYYDPRIEQDLQLDGEVYDRTDFDFGHMVRREDPVWGDERIARMANDDTFYMTNCAPQHNALNTKTWQTLENAILDSARASKRKVSVFTGPVLSPDDPFVLEVQVPTAFWKIVAYVESGELKAHGFMQWQKDLVDALEVREAISDGLGKAEEYQVTIREIAEATSLDFGPLLEADTPRGNGRSRRRRLNEALIDQLLPSRPAERGAAKKRSVVEEDPRPDDEPVVKLLDDPRTDDEQLTDDDIAVAARVLRRLLARLESERANGRPAPAAHRRGEHSEES